MVELNTGMRLYNYNTGIEYREETGMGYSVGTSINLYWNEILGWGL